MRSKKLILKLFWEVLVPLLFVKGVMGFVAHFLIALVYLVSAR